jgi:hypothetical protein
MGSDQSSTATPTPARSSSRRGYPEPHSDHPAIQAIIDQVGICFYHAVPFLTASANGVYKERVFEARGYRYWADDDRKFVTHVSGWIGDKHFEVSAVFLSRAYLPVFQNRGYRNLVKWL